MAGKDKVYIDIIVDDKGTTRRVAVDSKKLGVALDDVEKSQKRTGKSAKDADRNLKGLSKQSSNTTKNFSKMAQGMTGTLVPAYAILASNIFAITAAFHFLKKAADFRVMQDAQVAFTGATGVGMRSLTASIQEASGAMLDFQTASESAAIGTAAGLNVTQITQLAEGAANLSKILGRDVTDSYNRLIRGVTKAEPELLDELGIILRLDTANQNYAATLGKSAKDLSNFEKKMAVFNEVQGQLQDKFNAVSEATDVQANSVARLGVAFDKIMKPIKGWIAAMAEPTAEFFIKNIMSMSAALALLAIPIFKSIIPGLDDWAEKSKEAADDAGKAYKKAGEDLKKFEKNQADILKKGGVSAAAAKGAGKAKKGSGLEMLQAGNQEMLAADKKRVSAMLAHAEKGQGAIRQMNKRQAAEYLTTLRSMKRGHTTFTEDAGRKWRQMTNGMSAAILRVRSVYAGAMAGMKAATAAFAKYANKAMAAAGWIGMAVMAFDLLKMGAEKLGLIKPTSEMDALTGQFGDLTDKLKRVNEEYAKFAEIQATLRANSARTGESNFLQGLGAQGKFMQGAGSALREAATAQMEYGKANLKAGYELQELTKQEKAHKKALEEKGGFVAGKFKTMMATIGNLLTPEGAEGDWFDTSGAGNRTRAEDDALDALKAKQKAMDAANIAAGYNPDKDADSYVNLRVASEEAASGVVAYFKSLGPLTSAQAEYLGYAQRMADGKLLSPEAIERMKELEEGMVKTGQSADFVIQQGKEIETQFNKWEAGLTGYKTSVSDMMKTVTDQIGELNKLDPGGKNVQARLKRQNEILLKLKAQHELEVTMAKDKLKGEVAFIKANLGATPLQRERLARDQKIVANLAEQEQVQRKINQARALGDKADADHIAILDLQLEKLQAQNEELERAGDLAKKMQDDMIADFEGGLQKGIADVLKGDASIKEALAGMATSVASGMIDNVAKNLTNFIMDGLGFETEAQRNATAMKEGIEQGITAGATAIDTKIKDSSAPAIAKKIEEGTKDVSEGVKTAMTEGSTELATALEEVITRLIEQLREACHACMCPGEGDGTTPEGWHAPMKLPGQEGEGVGTKGSPAVGDGTTVPGAMDQLQEIVPTAQRRDDDLSGGTGLGEDKTPVDKLNATMKESNKITMKEVAGLGMAVTALLGNSKAGKAVQKIMAAFYLFEMGKTVWEKGKFLFEKLFGGKKLLSEGNLIVATWALVKATLAAAASGFIPGKTGIYPPMGYATGGVARGPMSGYPAILHGNEAVVPLPNGKDIPVTFPRGGGPGMQTNNVGVTINMNSEGDTDTEVDSDAATMDTLGIQIAEIVTQKLTEEKRAGGILSPYGET